mgnify:CR=1 FL=1
MKNNFYFYELDKSLRNINGNILDFQDEFVHAILDLKEMLQAPDESDDSE